MKRPAALLAAALLAACASTPQPAPGNWTSGRLTLRVEATAERIAQSLSASFDLQGNGVRGELRLTSALGLQVAAARWAPGQAELTTPQGSVRFDSLSELSRQALGEDVPLAALPDWLAGRPWANAAHELQPDGFAQLGWRVDLTHQLEGRLEARRAAPPAVTLRVRLEPMP